MRSSNFFAKEELVRLRYVRMIWKKLEDRFHKIKDNLRQIALVTSSQKSYNVTK